MESTKLYNLLKVSLILTILGSTTGCATYIVKAAYEQSKILLKREKIVDIIADDTRPKEIKEKLQLVLDVREFAKTLDLTPKNSFTYYSEFDRDVVSWIVVASKHDSFSLKTWWFPIVGSVPYKGYFDRESAESLAKDLQTQGYEASVRPTIAYSTLGWFNDPILTPLLNKEPLYLIETILHEILHTSYWVKNDVEFNESLANFFAHYAALEYCKDRRPDLAQKAQEALNTELAVAKTIARLYAKLEKLYDSNDGFDEKIIKKNEIFREEITSLRVQFPKLKILQTPNNAELMQLKLYLSGFDRFEEFMKAADSSAKVFFDRINDLRRSKE